MTPFITPQVGFAVQIAEHAGNSNSLAATLRFVLLAVAWLAAPVLSSAETLGPIEFNRDIRPLLSDYCFACHGPDHNKREADLRLDTETGLRGSAGAGPVQAGHASESLLIQRIEATDIDKRMPPKEFGKELSSEQIALLRRWIEQGAVWEGHWAFQPIRRPPVPSIAWPSATVDQPIDRFLMATLQRQQLRPAGLERPETLARRLHFDLLGLPPKPSVVERFSADASRAAYDQMVDELLASPHFGERMAMWWLDQVRYADSVGYHGDQPVSVSPFRDYVIQAFNRNLPFDQFTIEQLAGDMLPEPTIDQKIAAGYNRLGMMSAEGGVQPKEYLAKYASERVRNLSGAWLGVTLGCCECHDHKYDPFTTREFYEFEAFFADIEERGLYEGSNFGPDFKVPTLEQSQQLQEFDRRMAAVQEKLDAPTEALAAAQKQWERQQVTWTLLRPSELASLGGVTLTVLDDASILASGLNPATDTYTLTFADPPADVSAIRIEVLPDDSLPSKGPGRAGNGNFVLSEFEVAWHSGAGSAERAITLQNPTATYEQTGAAKSNPYKKWAVAAAIDGDKQGPTWGWAVMEQVGQANAAVFEAAEIIPGGVGSQLKLVLKQNLDNPQHTLGRFRISVTQAAKPIRAASLPPVAIDAILRINEDQRSEQDRLKLAEHYRSVAPELEPLRSELKQLKEARSRTEKSIPTMLLTRAKEPRMIRVLHRGNWMDDSGDTVQPAIPKLLGGKSSTGDRLNRLDLARWVVAKENPLTARVLANRLWKLFFGAGISRKLDDLGAQGESPSHPELLDWLASELVDSGWNIKQLVRLMVTSEAYRQSSLEPSAAEGQDPYNRWLAHQGRWRLEAEMVRDNALAISGLLVNELGGESVKPYQPRGYWAYLNFPQREWANGAKEELYRRGLYTHWQRQYLHPSLIAFDAPCREECAADRPRSNTPLQALVLLNDPTYVEAARLFAERMLREGGNADESRIAWGIREALVRPIRPQESAVLVELLRKHRSEYAQDPKSIEALLSIGERPVAADLIRSEVAAWTSIARTILNLHETINRN